MHSHGTRSYPSLFSARASQVALAEAQQTGYNLKRNEFEQEYDHEAECIISEMEFRWVIDG